MNLLTQWKRQSTTRVMLVSGIISLIIIGVWPSEEILAYYIYNHKSLLENIMKSKRIIELGAG